jgi:hypothetical protein
MGPGRIAETGRARVTYDRRFELEFRRGATIKDAKAWLDRLRTEAEECRLISKLATNNAKREAFASLAGTHDKAADGLQEL